jgi:hypothetical protein
MPLIWVLSAYQRQTILDQQASHLESVRNEPLRAGEAERPEGPRS